MVSAQVQSRITLGTYPNGFLDTSRSKKYIYCQILENAKPNSKLQVSKSYAASN